MTDQPSETEWCTVRNNTLSRSSSRHSCARSSGTSRALIVPPWASRISFWMTVSRDAPPSGTSRTSSGTGQGG